MQFQSRTWRRWAWAVTASALLDAGLCFGGAYLFADRREWHVAGFFLLLGLWAVQFLVGLKYGAFKILTYYLFEKRARIQTAIDLFHQYDMPTYDDLHFGGVEDYLNKAALSEDLTPDGRSFASGAIGALSVLRQRSMIETLQMLAVFEAAAETYARERRRNGWSMAD